MRLFVSLDKLTARVLEPTELNGTPDRVEHHRDLCRELGDEKRELFGGRQPVVFVHVVLRNKYQGKPLTGS